MKKKKREEFEDDGRVIANMNVDGMPWYTRPDQPEGSPEELKKLSKKETFWLYIGVVGAALLIAAVFALGFFLFIVFADKIWFRN